MAAFESYVVVGVGGWHSTKEAFALLTQQPWVRFSAFPRILDVAELIDWT